MLISMTLTLSQDHGRSAKAKRNRSMLSATQQAISIKTCLQRQAIFVRDLDRDVHTTRPACFIFHDAVLPPPLPSLLCTRSEATEGERERERERELVGGRRNNARGGGGKGRTEETIENYPSESRLSGPGPGAGERARRQGPGISA